MRRSWLELSSLQKAKLSIDKDMKYLSDLMIEIALMQFMTDEADCLKCKMRWYERSIYLVEDFKNFSFQVMNK